MRDFGASSHSHNRYSLLSLSRLPLRLRVNHWTSSVLLVLAITCTGCFGVVYDRTTTETIENPIPLKAPLNSANGFKHHWACQPGLGHVPLTKSMFLSSWGEPKSKEMSAEKETWIYAESGQWCGVWIVVGVPIPLLLPVCKTYDKITFENELAVSAISRRLVSSGIVVGPPGGGGWARAGNATDNRPSISSDMINDPYPTSCFWRPTQEAPVMRREALKQSIPDRVNCFSGGKRQWVERALCD